MLSVTTFSFDIAALELFLPLVAGGRVVIAARTVAVDPVGLGELIEAESVTVMQATPSSWRLLVESGWSPSHPLRALCGGEPLPAELARGLLPRVSELWNCYGPTETTVWSTVDRVSDPDLITIGTPIANTRVYVLDHHRQLVRARRPRPAVDRRGRGRRRILEPARADRGPIRRGPRTPRPAHL